MSVIAEGCLTVPEFAARLGVTRMCVYHWLAQSPSKCLRFGRFYLLTPAHQRELLAARKKIGRPRKKS